MRTRRQIANGFFVPHQSEALVRKLDHKYGGNVHIFNDLVATTMLAILSNEKTCQREVRRLAAKLYEMLTMAVMHDLFPSTNTGVLTPMTQFVGSRGMLMTDLIDPSTRVAIATLLRAGDVPASSVHETLGNLLNGGTIRQDYFGASRMTDDSHKVIGTQVTYRNIGELQGRILLIPDPMGATGGTLLQTVADYGETVKDAQAIIAVHLIVSPEYIRRLTAACPQVQIYTLRLDRGMSDPDVLASVPGTFPDREFGLNDQDYIVPGAGDLGWRLTGAR